MAGSTRRNVLAGCVVAGLVGIKPISAAQALQPFKVVAFSGASNWPIWAGIEKGFFAKQGIDVTLDITPGSRELVRNLYAGNYDLALTAIDNAIAYDEGQGEEPLPGPADFVAIMGVENGMLSLMAKPSIAAIADLRGRVLAVDALTTGFSFVLFELLGRAGINIDEVSWVAVGGGPQRLESLRAGKVDATLLNSPLDLAADAAGFKRLANVAAELGAYQGISGVVRRSRLAADRPRIIAFMRGFKAGLDWLVSPANREEAQALYMSRVQGATKPATERAYGVLLDPATGIYRNLTINNEGVKAVLALRSKFGKPAKTLSDPSKYLDLSLLHEAMG